jgi:hypothetical protein
MADPVSIWLAAAYDEVYRCCGWGMVRKSGADLSATAGGARHLTPEQARLSALIFALTGLPAGAGAVIHAANALAIVGQAASGPVDQTAQDSALFKTLEAAMAGRDIRFAAASPKAFADFVEAWAEFGRNKAKVTGPFQSAIPKTNLAKLKATPS